MVKNIAYATEEETLMGNGINLRTLTNDGGSAVISDYGAHLLRWAPAGQPDVIWTPRTWHFEAGQPVGGGVPVCFPWFGPGFVHGGQTAKRPIHGFARLRQWALDEGAFTGARVRYVLDSERLTTGEVPWIEDEPNVRFHAAYEVCASDTLTMTLTVTNTGGEPMSYEAALHSYLHVGRCARRAAGRFAGCNISGCHGSRIPAKTTRTAIGDVRRSAGGPCVLFRCCTGIAGPCAGSCDSHRQDRLAADGGVESRRAGRATPLPMPRRVNGVALWPWRQRRAETVSLPLVRVNRICFRSPLP